MEIKNSKKRVNVAEANSCLVFLFQFNSTNVSKTTTIPSRNLNIRQSRDTFFFLCFWSSSSFWCVFLLIFIVCGNCAINNNRDAKLFSTHRCDVFCWTFHFLVYFARCESNQTATRKSYYYQFEFTNMDYTYHCGCVNSTQIIIIRH